jgi:hypothetical protein
VPFRSEQSSNGMQVVILIEQAEANPELPNDAFAPPPAVAALLAD